MYGIYHIFNICINILQASSGIAFRKKQPLPQRLFFFLAGAKTGLPVELGGFLLIFIFLPSPQKHTHRNGQRQNLCERHGQPDAVYFPEHRQDQDAGNDE